MRVFISCFIASSFLLTVILTSAPISSAPPETSAQNKEVHFRKHIAPVLSARCVRCHNDKRARGGLNLTTRRHTMRGGESGPAVVAGNADNSLIYKMIAGPNPRMPRRGDALQRKEVVAFHQWINDGAAWPNSITLEALAPSRADVLTWWSRRKLNRPTIPNVKNENWVRTPIDAFILAMLEINNLSPSSEADRRTLLRRLKFDLHGVPPTIEEMEQFLNDREPDAYERLIDRLLADPRYGERWGRHWLDIIHYADTHGFDKDKIRPWAWLYRDWVINALNQDMAYHRFVQMQLAGDVIAPGESEGIIATGFIAAGPWDFVGHRELREGTVDKMKTRLLDRDDMVSNTMSTFVSTTSHCARCHDHKFDPIAQKEYYQLQAVFAGVERGDRTFLSTSAKLLKSTLQKQRIASLKSREKALAQIEEVSSPAVAKLDREITRVRQIYAALPMHKAKRSPTNGWHSRIERKQNVVKWVQVDLGKTVPIDEIRLLPARPTDYPDTPGFGFPLRFRVQMGNDPTFKKSMTLIDHSDKDYPNPGDVAIVIDGKGKQARHVRITANKLWLRRNDYIFALAELQAFSKGMNLARGKKVTSLDSIEAGRWSRRHLVDHFTSRESLPNLSDPKIRVIEEKRAKFAAELNQLSNKRKQLVAALVPKSVSDQLVRDNAMIALLDQRLRQIKVSGKVYTINPRAPRPIHVLHRGDVTKKKELVFAGALSLVPDLSGNLNVSDRNNEGQRRLALAKWITDKHNGLTYRSIVNRVWQYHFGRGLVDSPNDFGKNGSRPTHPKLLDWLAVEFRDGGQSLKALHKLILMSAVYRQSSRYVAAHAKIDGGNRFLWRMNRRKLDAESIRDSVLAVSGSLNTQSGGPGFKLFKFKDDHSPHYTYNVPEIVTHPKTFRRSVYRFIVRSVGNPFMECLDCADPNVSVPKRNKTLTANQALALLNNPFMMDQAKRFAKRLETMRGDAGTRIDAAFQLCYGRRANDEERALLQTYVRRHGWVNACRVLLNANEFVFVD